MIKLLEGTRKNLTIRYFADKVSTDNIYFTEDGGISTVDNHKLVKDLANGAGGGRKKIIVNEYFFATTNEIANKFVKQETDRIIRLADADKRPRVDYAHLFGKITKK